jgi:hypothetical protein
MTKIAILSDSHDHLQTLEHVLEACRQAGAEVLLHLGDLVAPFMLDTIGRRFSGPVHVVFGNNDGDGRLLQVIAFKHPHVHLHGIYAELEIGGRQVALVHYPEIARRVAQSGAFDLVCYGHNHEKRLEPAGAGWLLNPGELMGLKSAPTWALYDTDTGKAEILAVA